METKEKLTPKIFAEANKNSKKGIWNIILEVGCGAKPFLPSAVLQSEAYRTWFQSDPSLQYFAIDWIEDDLKRGQEYADMIGGTGLLSLKRTHFVHANGQDLALADSSVGEVIFANVMGGGTNRARPLIDEAARILKIGGVLKIIELYEPWHALEAGGPIAYLKNKLQKTFQIVPPPESERELDARILSRNAGEQFISRFRKNTIVP